jgi:hypothetical protein
MDAPSPDTNRAICDWLSALPSGYADGEGDVVRHAILLQRCFDGREMRWSDALVARTRRHIGGCVTAVEMALKLELAAASPETALPSDPLCWLEIQKRPALLSPPLLAAMRNRAAIGLMAHDHAYGDGAANSTEADLAEFPHSAQDILASLALGQAGWADVGPDDTPIRVDLPAEAYPELLLTVGAVLANALVASGQPPALYLTIDRACAALLARYDEQPMPYAQAALFAHQMRLAELSDAQLLALSRQRHILALLGIAADRLGLDLPCLVQHVVEATEQAVFTLCRAAQFPREVAVRLVLGRRSVARGVDDSVLVHYAEAYDGMTLAEALNAVAVLGLSRAFQAKLSLVRAQQACRDA